MTRELQWEPARLSCRRYMQGTKDKLPGAEPGLDGQGLSSARAHEGPCCSARVAVASNGGDCFLGTLPWALLKSPQGVK